MTQDTAQPTVAEMLSDWKAENGYTNEEAAAALLMSCYRFLRVIMLMREAGCNDWDGVTEDDLAESVASVSAILDLHSVPEQMESFVASRMDLLHRMPYDEYLRTSEWRDVRYFARWRAGTSCQVCDRTGRLDVHHRTYVRRGVESLSDVIVLCRPCHELFHREGRVVR